MWSHHPKIGEACSGCARTYKRKIKAAIKSCAVSGALNKHEQGHGQFKHFSLTCEQNSGHLEAKHMMEPGMILAWTSEYSQLLIRLYIHSMGRTNTERVRGLWKTSQFNPYFKRWNYNNKILECAAFIQHLVDAQCLAVQNMFLLVEIMIIRSWK